MSNEQLMWISIAIWVGAILLFGYYAIWGKTFSSQLHLPSGNVTSDPSIGGGGS